MHVGADMGSGLIHTIKVTPANVHDATVAHELLREDDMVVYGDSAYCSLEKHEEIKNNENVSKIEFRTNKQKPYRKNAWVEGEWTRWLRHIKYQKSRVRSKFEFAFHVVKDLFNFRKTRYRGLKKLEATVVYMLFATANFYMILMGQKGSTKLQRRKALV